MEEELSFKIPHFEEPKDLEDLKRQVAILGEAIEQCEKMLQHLAISNFGETSKDLDFFMCQHIQLISIKNRLAKKREEMTTKTTPSA